MNPDSGHFIRTAKREFPIYSSIAETFEYSIYGCAEWEVFVDGLDEPSGLDISEGLVYVSEHGTGKVLAFDRVTRQQIDSVQTDADSLLGIALDGHGNLWYSDSARSEVSKLVVEETCEESSIPDHGVEIVVGGPAGWRVQDYTEVTAVVGQNLAFEFEAFHDVYLMPDQAAFDACDFTSATRLANSVDSPYIHLVETAGTVDFADAEVHHCGGNSVTLSAAMAGMPTADADGNYRMNNDALLMEGYLCHVCLPEPCSNGGVCSHIPWGFTCDCSGTGYGGDTCSTPVPLEPCARAFGRQAVAQVVATDAHGLASPRDLQFHPINPDELWVANNDTDSLTIIDTVAGTAVTRKDRAPYHYMERISSLAFDSRGYFATCQESDNTYDDMMIANHFMGPTLFHSAESDLVNQLGEPECNTEDPETTCFFTHWDMLHESPLCMGIAHDPEDRTPFGNVYWAFDGLNSSLIRYDFSEPHGPGSLDHSIAAIRRYPEIELTRVPGIPGHLMMDPTERVLYIADTGGGRILRMNPDSGHFIRTAKREFPIYSSIAETFEYSIYGCAEWEVFADGLDKPSGLHVDDTHVYVAEWQSSTIVAFDKASGTEVSRVNTGASGLNGIAVDSAGHIWFSDGPSNTVSKVTVELPCAASSDEPAAPSPVVWPERECTMVVDNNITIDHTIHTAGYMNLSGFLGIAD